MEYINCLLPKGETEEVLMTHGEIASLLARWKAERSHGEIFSWKTEREQYEGEAMSYGISCSLLGKLKSTSNGMNDILRHGVEENHHIRVMVVGKAGVGKTTLTRRLIQFPVNIRQYNITDGIDVHIHTCEVNLDSGEWSKYYISFYLFL